MRFNRVWSMLVLLVSSGSPESRTQRYAVISRVRATGPRLPFANVVICQVGMAGLEPALLCSHDQLRTVPAGCRYPTSRHPVRTGGFEPGTAATWSSPGPRPGAITRLRHVLPSSSSCGSRTRLHALKGRDPQTDRRTSRLSAHLLRSGSGGARIRLSWFSARRYDRLSYRPKRKKPDVVVTPGFWYSSGKVRPDVTCAMDRTGAYSPIDRRMYPFLFAFRNSAVLKSWLFLSMGSSTRAVYLYSIVIDAAEAEMVHGKILKTSGPIEKTRKPAVLFPAAHFFSSAGVNRDPLTAENDGLPANLRPGRRTRRLGWSAGRQSQGASPAGAGLPAVVRR